MELLSGRSKCEQLRSCVLLLVVWSSCFTLTNTQTDQRQNQEAMNYLQKYHYMGEESPDPYMQQLQDGDVIATGIRRFQRMANIPETGKVDEQTMEMMKKPRCGFPDVVDMGHRQGSGHRQKRYSLLGHMKWPKHDLTYRIVNYTPKLSQSDVEYWIQKAFETWSSVTPLRFYQVYRGQADINIQFGRYHHGDAYPFDGPGGTLAHAFGPSEGIGGDAHFDDDEPWTVRLPRDGNDLYTVAVHELGHSLGLAHSNAHKAIMRPFYEFSHQTGVDALSRDDVAGIQYLYGVGHPTWTDKPAPTTTTTTTRAPRTSSTRRPKPPVIPSRRPLPVPEHCGRDVHLDAIVSTSSGKTYAFEGWRYVYIWEGSNLDVTTPKLVSEVFYELHWGVDAAFTVWDQGREVIYILKAWFVWTYDANTLDPIRQLIPWADVFPAGLRNSPSAAFKSEADNHVYIFQGSLYWRLEGEHNGRFSTKLSPGYPKHVTEWTLPFTSIDAAMSWQGDTYFFQGNNYYKINEYSKQVVSGYPREISVWWLGCPDLIRQWPMVDVVREGNGSSMTSQLNVVTFSVLTTLSLLLTLI